MADNLNGIGFSGNLFVSNFPEKPQHRHHANDNAWETGANGDDTDCLFLEGVKPGTEGSELRLHPVVTIRATNYDFQGEQATIHHGDSVANVLPAKVTALG